MKTKTSFAFILGICFLLALYPVFGLTEIGGDSGSISVDGTKEGIVVGPVYTEPCGNGILESWEQCDGGNLAGKTCASLGFNSGTLSCHGVDAGSNKCTFNNQCFNSNTDTGDTGSGGSGGGSGGSGGGGGGSGGASFSASCAENWTCSSWGECNNGKQTRSCTDTKKCETTKLKPVELRDCSVEGESGEQAIGALSNSKGVISRITGAVIGGGVGSWITAIIFILLIAGLLWWILRKKNSD
jgi:hypothetical protein